MKSEPTFRINKFAPWIAIGSVATILGLGALLNFTFNSKSENPTATTGLITAIDSSPITQAPFNKTDSNANLSSSKAWQSTTSITKVDKALEALPRHPIAGGFKLNTISLASCKDNNWQCLEQAYGNLVFTEGPKIALAQFDKAIALRGPTEQNCHRIAHTMGSAALERFKGSVAKAFAAGSSSCWSGYYHGILEHAFQTEKLTAFTSDELSRIAKKFCDDPDVRVTNWIAYQCVHGLGHGLMITTELDLDLTLESCNKLATDWDRQSCKGGAFMENISSSYGTTSKWLKKDDLIYPCNAIKEGDKLYCYLMVTSRILNANGFNWDATAKLCQNAEKNWVAVCFQSFGRDASGSSRQNAADILRLCAGADKFGGQLNCILGAAKDVTANYTNGEIAARMCDQASGLERACYWAVGTISAGFTATVLEREQDCQKITSNLIMVQACIGGTTGQPVPEREKMIYQ